MTSHQESKLKENIIFRKAIASDCEEIVRLIMELAEFEKMADQMKMTPDKLRTDCFREHPLCSCIVASKAEDPTTLVGYALFFPVYSTWEGASMYLEDLYITPDFRGRGLGKLLWQSVAKVALSTGSKRLSLAVLGWNHHARDMYVRNGCQDLTESEDWHMMRLDHAGMEKFVSTMDGGAAHNVTFDL